MQQNLNRFGISSQDYQLCNTSVECFGGFICAFLQLLVIGRLLNKIQQSNRQVGVRERECLWVWFAVFHFSRIVLVVLPFFLSSHEGNTRRIFEERGTQELGVDRCEVTRKKETKRDSVACIIVFFIHYKYNTLLPHFIMQGDNKMNK